MTWTSRAPGSLMLFGEHAVLSGKPAIACSIDHWLSIDWQQRSDQQIHIHSSLAEHVTDWNNLHAHPKLSFVMTLLSMAAQHYPTLGQYGLNIRIRSDINATQGLGSSSAVVAAMLVGLSHLEPALTKTQTAFQLGLAVIRHIQGAGSGTDLASALTGGVMQFDPVSQHMQRLADELPLISLYVGYKTPTAEVIRLVRDTWPADHPLWLQWLDWTSQLTLQAAEAIMARDDQQLGRLMNMAHGLMQGLGVSDVNLDRLVHQLRQQNGIKGAKISGSGLGDCVIALGNSQHHFAEQVPLTLTPLAAHLVKQNVDSAT